MIRYMIGDVSFELKSEFDFSFIEEYGIPFRVFDEHDSGNLCFGVAKDDRKLFIKIAGAETMRSNTEPRNAVERLKRTAVIYEVLRHPYLLNQIDYRAVNGGYIQVFEWFDGLCMGKQYGHTERFLRLPVDQKLDIFQCILEFHSHVNKLGYVAIDFYDGSIMYDFNTKQARICDIEFYSKMPYVNEMGRMWGSGRFMLPEEFEKGAVIDERTNVFTMGATAFQLFGGGIGNDISQWQLSEKRYAAARRAVDVRRENRFASINEFIAEWNRT